MKSKMFKLTTLVALVSLMFSCNKSEYPNCYSPEGSSIYVVESGTMTPVANANVFIFGATSWDSEELLHVTKTSASGLCSWPCENKATGICVEAGDKYWDYCNGTAYELMQGELRDKIYELRTKAWIRFHVPKEYTFVNEDGYLHFVSPNVEMAVGGEYEENGVYYIYEATGDVPNKFLISFNDVNHLPLRSEEVVLVPVAGDTLDYYYPLSE